MLNARESGVTDLGLTYVISSLQHGQFKVGGSSELSFNQAQVKAGAVTFVQDGTTNAPSYYVSVSDGTTSTIPASSTVTFDSAPILVTNQLTITQGQSIIVSTANINANDVEQNSSQLTFIISNLQHGRFERVSAPGTSITTFTLSEIQDNQIRFVQDGSTNEPSYMVSVSDGQLFTIPVIASIDYKNTTELNPTNSNIWRIVGGIVGGVAAIGCTSLLLYKCYCKKTRNGSCKDKHEKTLINTASRSIEIDPTHDLIPVSIEPSAPPLIIRMDEQPGMPNPYVRVLR